jgi:hypothetical protein
MKTNKQVSGLKSPVCGLWSLLWPLLLIAVLTAVALVVQR